MVLVFYLTCEAPEDGGGMSPCWPTAVQPFCLCVPVRSAGLAAQQAQGGTSQRMDCLCPPSSATESSQGLHRLQSQVKMAASERASQHGRREEGGHR